MHQKAYWKILIAAWFVTPQRRRQSKDLLTENGQQQIVLYSYNALLYSNETERIKAICHNIEELHKHNVDKIKPDTKAFIHTEWLHLHKAQKQQPKTTLIYGIRSQDNGTTREEGGDRTWGLSGSWLMFYFLIWAVVTWKCLLCNNSSLYTYDLNILQ